MSNVKLNARRPSRQEIRFPVLLRQMPENALDLLSKHSEVIKVPAGCRITHREGERGHLLFVIRGKFTVRDSLGAIQHIQGGTTRSHFPMVSKEVAGAECVSAADSEILRIPNALLSKVQSLNAQTLSAQPKPPDSELEDRVYREFHQALKNGDIKLPAMPDVAVRIARHIDAPESTSESIARIVQLDPSVTARLIQVANSPAFGGSARTETARDAVTRLGREVTRDLVTSFVLRGVFRTRSAPIKQRMHELWEHSTQVAAVCHALARRSPGFDPAQALLMGLVHDIGVIPILMQAQSHESLLAQPKLLERLIDRLRSQISAATLRNWGFSREFVAYALEAEDWFRNKRPEVDYGDILIMAQLHAFVGSSRMKELPRMDEVPAFRKLALGELSPRMSLLVLDEAKREIDDVRQMIS